MLKSPRPPPISSSLGPHHENLVLLKLTAVCRRWRLIASDCAILWTSIAFSVSVRSTIQCATLFLGRSKEAMLSVYIWSSGSSRNSEISPDCKGLLGAIASQSHRLSTCELSSPSPEFWSYWSSPAPNLRNLTVQGYGAKVSPIFCSQIPGLQSITLLNYVPGPLGNYTTLRHADLRNHNRNVSLTSLLDALRGCEKLERLALHGYGHLRHEAPHPAIVSLPLLFKFDLFSSDSALILEHLDTPSLTGPVIIFNSSPGDHILHALPRTQSRSPYLQGITKLQVVLNSSSAQYYVAGYREDGSIALYIGVCGVGHWFRWTWAGASIAAVASFVHFSTIRDLVFTTDAVVIPWDLWLSNLDHLRELTVSCPRSEGLLVSLLGASPEDGPPPCSSLRSLAIYRCGRCAVVDHVGLMGFVVSRYRAGRPLRELRLHKDEWDWIQLLDKSWVALAQLQCTCFERGNARNLLIPEPATKGDNVLIELPLEVDLEALANRFDAPGRLNIVDWSNTGFSL